MDMLLQDMVMGMVNAFKGGDYSIFASMCIMFVVFMITKSPVASFIKGEAKVWVAACAGVLAAVAATVISGGSWMSAVMQGFTVGLTATGLFEVVKRKLAKKPIDANNDGELDPLE